MSTPIISIDCELRHVRIFALQQLIRTGLDIVEMKENLICLEVTIQ